MSLTIVGLIATMLAKIAQSAGYTGNSVTVEQLMTTGMTVVQVVGLVVAYIGRVRKGDLNWWGGRKTL